MPLALRSYREADLPALHALDQLCFAPGIAYSRSQLRAFLQHPSAFSSVAADGNRILGFAVVRPLRRKPAGGSGPQPVLHLLTIDVAPEARRRGVGSLLMRWAISKGSELGSRAILLEVAVDNPAAQGFYAAFGFAASSTIPGYYNGITDALRMELPLPRDPV